MTKYKVRGTGQSVDLNQGNFKTKGGEGSIYIIGNIVYKICESGKMIPEGKFSELNLLDHPKIVRPEDILLDSKNRPVGYTMKLVPGNSMPLARILSKTYRERENVTPDMMSNLVKQLVDGVRFIHSKPNYLQVDGNENNYMITDNYKDLYFIDVNSFQTPNYPADAIMASIRDYHCPKNSNGLYLWSHETDWYSTAIITFYMFTGIHAFKGFHPLFKNLKTAMVDQMKACKSVLDSEVKFPEGAVYCPFENFIPGGANGAFMQWYRAIFIDNKRLPAPIDFQSTIKLVAQIKEIIGSNTFTMEELREYVGQIVGYYSHAGKDVVVTTDNIYVSNQTVVRPAKKFRVGFTPIMLAPVAAWLENENLMLKNMESKEMIPCNIKGSDIMTYNGRIYVKSSKDIFEIVFIENAKSIIVAAKSVANIMPYATELFQGVAIQDMFGTKNISVFPESGHHRMIPIKELVDFNISDAKFENNVLMIIGSHKKTGEYTRFVFRFARQWDKYDVRLIENISPSGLNFTVTDNGICVSITEEEKVEIFSSACDSPGLKSISDPAIKADMRLCHSGAQVRFAHNNKLYDFAVRK